MAIYDINTIQGDVNTSYGDEYIKQALANLGQRQGLKGDAIQTQTFKISDVIFDSTNTIVPKLYIKGYYDAIKDVIGREPEAAKHRDRDDEQLDEEVDVRPSS